MSEPPTQETASENGEWRVLPERGGGPPAADASRRAELSSAAGGGGAGSLEASAAAYTKATARRCLLEKVEVITGEEAESNVLQVGLGGRGPGARWM